VRAVAVVVVLPLLQLVVEDLRVVDDQAVEHPVELLGVDAVRGRRCGASGGSKHPEPAKYTAGTVVGVDHVQADDLGWKVFGERTIYDNQWVRLVKVDVQPPNGQRFEHHVVRLQRVILTVVLDDADRVLMMWRHRFATNEWGWELPGGIVDQGEDAAGTAVREVEEETGWRPEAVEHLVSFQPMPGMVDTPHEVYLGHGAVKVGEPTDIEEAARIEWVPIGQVLDLVRKGELLGSGSLVGLLYLLAQRSTGGQLGGQP
jgi:8-oxo-dGTP pyrophosphatase MutT (NUDIX family)